MSSGELYVLTSANDLVNQYESDEIEERSWKLACQLGMIEAELSSSLINDEPITTSSSSAFDMDESAWIRAFVVIIGLVVLTGIYCGIKCYRRAHASRSRIRKYDIVSTRELQTGLAIDSDSDDDIFGPTSDRQKLFSGEHS